MTYLVELPVKTRDGSVDVVKVEVTGPAEGLVRAARPGQVVARAARSLDDMLAGVRPVAQSFIEGLSDMTRTPDEIKLEFGMSLSLEADVVISKTSAEATFAVSLTWKNPSTES